MGYRMRKFLQKLFAFILRIYFRRVEVFGEEHVPEDGPVIFVLNHYNALIDPLFILCLAPRDVSFLAKSTLFRMPIVGFLTKKFDSIPVYRKQDQGEKGAGNMTGNQKTFAACRELLSKGGSMALFPEGISHNKPNLQPFKSGTARIALGAASMQKGDQPVRIVPAGLYYTEKQIFRSDALMCYGPSVEVEVVELDENFEPPREAVHALTDQLKEALAKVTLEAKHDEVLSLVEKAEGIFSSTSKNDLAEEMEMRKRFLRAYDKLQENHHDRLNDLKDRIDAYASELNQWGVQADKIKAENFKFSVVMKFILKRLLIVPILVPLAILGTLIHYLPYRLIGTIATRVAKRDTDMLSTVKILGSILFFPLTWGLIGGGLWYAFSWQIGLAAFVLAPITGLAANGFWESLYDTLRRSRAFGLFMARRNVFDNLVEERRQIRKEIFALGELVGELPEA